MRRIKILVVTDDFEKWIEKFEASLKIDFSRGVSWIRKNEVMLGNELFQIQMKTHVSENCRGLDPNIIIVDKEIESRVEDEILKPLLGHSGSYIRGDNYEVIYSSEEEREFKELENEIVKSGLFEKSNKI